MSSVRLILAEIFGLFVDDGSLALSVLALVAVLGAAVLILPGQALAVGVFLVVGCCVALAASTLKAARR